MPKRLILLLVVSCWFLAVNSIAKPLPVFSAPTCDLCGWCSTLDSEKPSDWVSCVSCLYTDYPNGTTNPKAYYTVIGCLSTSPGDFVKTALKILVSISGGIGFLAFLGGSIMVLTSSGDPIKLKNGKETIMSSILGLMLIIFSIFLLRVIGYEIFRIPGFG